MTPQNFTIPAGTNELIAFSVDPDVTPVLDDVTIWWRVYELQFGVPNFGYLSIGSPSPLPLIEKTYPEIIAIDSPLSFTVQLFTADTIGLLRNYYHEATIVGADLQVIGGAFGIMTVTATENRQSGITS